VKRVLRGRISAETWRKTVDATTRSAATIGDMLEVRLRSGTVVAFDGRVLEIFDAVGGSQRFHVTGLSTPRLLEDPDGSGRIVLDEPRVKLRLARGETPACARLIAAIEHARAADGAVDS